MAAKGYEREGVGRDGRAVYRSASGLPGKRARS